ncbi:ABC transporter ATP-binding protein [uncultured Algimonas sp.]|uniref:ABC transporter ATP-binding protein n=1 Tax=uncultured Algimonas sp. TaxID=1547920 RepID=UPI002606C40A|nr:ABC transporter ATP-binding protein [uncultured Algimonas sp.]
MLKAETLTVTYGSHTALGGLDLDIAEGEIYALLGPNGAGKTTTINAFLGFVDLAGGRTSVAGINVQENPVAARRALAYIPEQVNLYGWFSGLENLDYFARLGGQSYDHDVLKRFLTQAGLQEEAFGRKVVGYSKGMRQKVGIAIALAKQAKALLLDEPTSGLDPAASYEFSESLKRVSGQGVAVLMATHDLFRALDIADRIGIMHSGILQDERAAKELSARELESLYLSVARGRVHQASSGMKI